MGDDKILTKVAVGHVVTNELEFRKRLDSLVECPEDNLNYSGTSSLEEVLSQIDEDISDGRKFFPLKDIHQEVIRKDRQYGYEREMNRTRLKEDMTSFTESLVTSNISFLNPVSSFKTGNRLQDAVLQCKFFSL